MTESGNRPRFNSPFNWLITALDFWLLPPFADVALIRVLFSGPSCFPVVVLAALCWVGAGMYNSIAPGGSQSAVCALIGFGMLMLALVLAKRASKWNKQELPSLQTAWEQSWICYKCGHTFRL